MTDGEELAMLRQAWRKGGQPPPKDLHRSVVRKTWLLRVEVATSILTAIVFLGGSAWKAVRAPSPEFVVLAIGVWIVTIAALLFSIRNWAGLWESAGVTAIDFLALSIRRCQAGLKATTFGLWFLLLQVVFVGSWQAWYWSGRSPVPSLRTWLLASCLPMAVLIVLLVMRASHRRELQRLEQMRRELTQ
ncbi:MAG: hypothetical protein ACRD8O_14455 [Bryobacteraceae bacterium]